MGVSLSFCFFSLKVLLQTRKNCQPSNNDKEVGVCNETAGLLDAEASVKKWGPFAETVASFTTAAAFSN
jgi:hypothetical protein